MSLIQKQIAIYIGGKKSDEKRNLLYFIVYFNCIYFIWLIRESWLYIQFKSEKKT
jgi:hypothetical protein